MRYINIVFRKFKTVIKEPKWLLIRALGFVSPLIDDSLYLKMLFPLRTGYKLNLENPRTFNEKLQWLKINYRNPKLTLMADKYTAKFYTAKTIGEQYVVKNYGVWNSFEDIDFGKLPSKFVLKTTHDQGGLIICHDKNKLDLNFARKKLNKHLKSKNYYLTREWPYKNIKPRIIAEELLSDDKVGDLWDYKFYCFHGEPKIMYISMGRNTDKVPFFFYDMDFNKLDITRPGHHVENKKIEKPLQWDLMVELAKKTSQGIPHVRVDFYCIDDKVLSGEYTFFQGGGMMPFSPESWDLVMGNWIHLNEV